MLLSLTCSHPSQQLPLHHNQLSCTQLAGTQGSAPSADACHAGIVQGLQAGSCSCCHAICRHRYGTNAVHGRGRAHLRLGSFQQALAHELLLLLFPLLSPLLAQLAVLLP